MSNPTNENTDVNKLIEERNEWIKKYKTIESECLELRDKLEKVTPNSCDKNEDLYRNYSTSQRDISMKYKYMENQCELLSTKLKITTLEKEKETQKNKDLQIIINKQKNEINGYQKILEKLKNMNVSFRKEKNEAEKKICSIIGNDLLTRNDNVLLKEIVLINDKLIDVNNKIRENVKEDLEKAKSKLSVAHDKIKRFSDALSDMKENFTKYKKKKEKFLLEILTINKQLKEELKKKKLIEKYNIECKKQFEEFSASNVLLNYYEAKYKMNDFILHVMLHYVISILNSLHMQHKNKDDFNSSNGRSKNYSLLCTLLNTHVGMKKKESEKYDNSEIYHEQMNILKREILSDNFPQRQKKKGKMVRYEDGEISSEHDDSLEMLVFTNLNASTNIVHGIYYNIRLVNEIFETVNITLILLLYIYDTYLKELINSINQETCFQMVEKGNVRFGAFFLITLSNFFLSVLKYVNIIKSSNRHAHFLLLQNENIFSIFCLCKYVLEQYIEKIKIKLFSSTIDYHILNVLNNKLGILYEDIFNLIMHINAGYEEKQNMEFSSSLVSKYDINQRRTKLPNDDESIETKMINKSSNENTDEGLFKEENFHHLSENITSLELLTRLNLTMSISILLIIDEDVYSALIPDIDIDIQKEIITKCEELLKLVKAPHKISNFFFPLKKYKFSFKNFIVHSEKYQKVVIKRTNNESSIEGVGETEGSINKISNNLLDEINNILEDATRIYSIDVQQEGEPYIFQICNKFVDFYKDEMSKEKQNVHQQKALEEEQDNLIKQLNDEITKSNSKIHILNKQLNLLTIREEKYNKINIDLNTLKKEKNEYLSLITELRENKNENLNEISYLTKHYNDMKKKYNDLLKNYEHRKKYIGSNKQMEPSNIDIYYMKKIINHLYYENFMNKVNNYYDLYVQTENNYHNELCNTSTIDAFQPTPLHTALGHLPFGQYAQKREDISLACKNNFNQKESFKDDVYFSNVKHATLYDDIYNCELIKGRINRKKKDYFKSKLYQNNTTLQKIPTSNKKEKYMEQIIDIIEEYKNLKNEIFSQMINIPIGNNHILAGEEKKKDQQNWIRLTQKLAQLKYALKKFHTENDLTLLNGDPSHSAQNVLSISFQEESNSSCNTINQTNHIFTDLHNPTKLNEYQSCNKVVLSEQSFSHLLQNMFHL
ncbi:hypothetical protein, conserved [Plasmodium gonderi]|uniref:Uncharacterized protein n=1 Tax=Plasmodium gonderi TaxID=77519 RepID=A0A1Y1JKX0_PLAGO|nr:hypothetical protein, conserved [Plasmodium gonderi]GAW82095.1 hypothetical protein, conserved [Plasmodium gonderi]